MRRSALVLLTLISGCSGVMGRTAVPFVGQAERASGGTHIASLQVRVTTPVLPLGQTTALRVIARDANGHVISGAFDHPISLRARLLALSASSAANSTAANALTASWSPSASGQNGTVTASADGHTANAGITASSGFRYFNVGNDPATDVTGFQIVASPQGTIYYGTLGPQTCSGNVCASQQGAIGELNPRTGAAHQIALPSEVLGLLVASDKGLWIAGGAGHLLYRMSPGPLSTPAAMIVPPPKTGN